MVHLTFWHHNRTFLKHLRDITFAGISCRIMQPSRCEARCLGVYSRAFPTYCLLFKEDAVRAACSIFRPWLQKRYGQRHRHQLLSHSLLSCACTPRQCTNPRFSGRSPILVGAALEYINAKEQLDIKAAKRALRFLWQFNDASKRHPLLPHELAPQEQLDEGQACSHVHGGVHRACWPHMPQSDAAQRPVH